MLPLSPPPRSPALPFCLSRTHTHTLSLSFPRALSLSLSLSLTLTLFHALSRSLFLSLSFSLSLSDHTLTHTHAHTNTQVSTYHRVALYWSHAGQVQFSKVSLLLHLLYTMTVGLTVENIYQFFDLKDFGMFWASTPLKYWPRENAERSQVCAKFVTNSCVFVTHPCVFLFICVRSLAQLSSAPRCVKFMTNSCVFVHDACMCVPDAFIVFSFIYVA